VYTYVYAFTNNILTQTCTRIHLYSHTPIHHSRYRHLVSPSVHVQVKCIPKQIQGDQEGDQQIAEREPVRVFAENYNLRYILSDSIKDSVKDSVKETPKDDALNSRYLNRQRHNNNNLIDAAIRRMDIPLNLSIEVCVHSDMPAGASTGTSAAVSVAIIAGKS